MRAPSSPRSRDAARTVLAGERTALNGLMMLSGIATEARRWQQVAGEELAVLDTRKTLPGLRTLSKYAVRVGGAHNHREGLYDMVLVKDNHIAACRRHRPRPSSRPARRIPISPSRSRPTRSSQAAEAARAGADIVMLDNMDDEELAEAVAAVREAPQPLRATRCSPRRAAGSSFERLPAIAAAGCDRVSTSAITLAPPLDFGLDKLD